MSTFFVCHHLRVHFTVKTVFDNIESLKSIKAEDIYTAAGWESMYQNGYVHCSPSRFSAKSAIYTAAGCQHIIAIYTAAVPEQFKTIYTAAVCLHKIAIYTAAIQEPNRLNTLLPGVYIKLLFTRQPFKSQLGYIHCCRVYIYLTTKET